MLKKALLLFICLVAILLMITGCKPSDVSVNTGSTSSATNPSAVGTIQGVIKDLDGTAIQGAVLSLAYNGSVHTFTSDAAGQFSFDNVPVGTTTVANGAYVVTTPYTITASLVDFNKTQADSSKKYRNYYYDTVFVGYTKTAKDSTVASLVGTVVVSISKLGTTITGSVVDANQQVVSGAIVYLYDQTITPGLVLKQTTTDVNGNYTFANVDNGIKVNMTAVTSDGKWRGSIGSPLQLSLDRTKYVLNAGTTAELIKLATSNTVAPYVYQITPATNSDVAVNTPIVYTFTEPIKQTSYTRTDLGLGYSTILDDIIFTYTGLKKTDAAIVFTAAWNSSFTTLTVTPTNIVGSAKYSINVATAMGKLTDSSNITVVNNTALTGDFENLLFTTAGGSQVPGVPSVTRRLIPGVFGTLDYTGGTVGLKWVPADTYARSYNIYRSVNGGSYELYRSNVFALQDTVSTGSLVYPAGVTNPLYAATVSFKVTAVSKDLIEETTVSTNNIVTIQDGVLPIINSAVATASATTAKVFNVYLSEPVQQTLAENPANFTVQDTTTISFPVALTVNQASYLGYSASPAGYRVQLNVTSANAVLPTHYVLTVSQAVKDLMGNAMDTTTARNKFGF